MVGEILLGFIDDLCDKDDYVGLISCIVSAIRDDPTFAGEDYEKICKYLTNKGKLDGLFQPYEKVPGEPGNKDKSQWDEKYFIDRTFALKENFSRERLAHVKEVGKYVYRGKPTPGKEEALKNNIINRIKEELNIDISKKFDIYINDNDDNNTIRNKIINDIKKII